MPYLFYLFVSTEICYKTYKLIKFHAIHQVVHFRSPWQWNCKIRKKLNIDMQRPKLVFFTLISTDFASHSCRGSSTYFVSTYPNLHLRISPLAGVESPGNWALLLATLIDAIVSTLTLSNMRSNREKVGLITKSIKPAKKSSLTWYPDATLLDLALSTRKGVVFITLVQRKSLKIVVGFEPVAQ